MKHTRILLLIALLGAAAVGLPSLRGATITVTEVGDGFDVHTNLRQALADANDGDTIEFDPQLGGYTLGLMPSLGELVVNKSVTIIGLGASRLAVDAQHADRVFYISPGKTVTISGLTITNGSAPTPYYGGGIYNDHASLTVSSCIISGNSAPQGVGGGIFNDQGTLIVSGSTLSGNSSWYGGGISNNWLGAGSATVTITNSTLSGNSASLGGGIVNDSAGTVTMTNSTLSGNSAGGLYEGLGGGIYNTQTLTIINSTLSGNSAVNQGGGIYNTSVIANAILTIGSTILNAGSSGGNIYNGGAAAVASLGYNLSSDNSGGYLTATGDQINADPRLGPLQDNGGLTFTHLPASNSLAIDAGDPTVGMDQRGPGFVRVTNGRIDIGAVESQATPTPTPTPKPHGHH